MGIVILTETELLGTVLGAYLSALTQPLSYWPVGAYRVSSCGFPWLSAIPTARNRGDGMTGAAVILGSGETSSRENKRIN